MVQDVWSIPDGRKIIVPCNELGQAIGDAGGLLGGFLGVLGSDFNKFPICYISWRKVPQSYKDAVYNSIIQNKFHIVDNRLKNDIMKRIGKAWKDTRSILFHEFYDSTLSKEENVANRPPGIDENHWRWFIDYRLSEKTQDLCKRNTENRKKQLYTHTGGSKTIARRKHEEERQRGSSISRGELWVMLHKKKDGSYIHDNAEVIGEKIINIEREDDSSKGFSKIDSLSQAIGKEHPGRVRGVGSGPCPTQVFGQTSCSNAPVDFGLQTYMTEMKSELEASRVKVQNLESIIETERSRRQAFEGAVKYILQMQGSNLPPELATLISAMAPDEGSAPALSQGARPSSSASHDAQQLADHSNRSPN
ncbi:uncharacterized protein LOC141834431 [Curcuma longa]|uniref:uncharacterized protein LOC141834431 n=1 Tax=Curcuma longa TaxID=136217 RepID=UPI003D9F55D7